MRKSNNVGNTLDKPDSRVGRNDASEVVPRTGIQRTLPPYGIRRFEDEDTVQLHAVDHGDAWTDMPQGKPNIYSRAPQFFMHYLNLPLREQYPLVKSRYNVLDLMTKTWDIDHPQYPFFMAKRKLAITFIEEDELIHIQTDGGRQWFIDNREKLCERLASFSGLADTLSKMELGAFANLAIMCRFKGDTPTNRLGTAFRWNLINRRCSALGTHMQATGAWSYIASHSQTLTDTSPYGAPMYSTPAWIVVPWGNVGDHEWDWKSYLSEAVSPDVTQDEGYRNLTIAVDALKDAGVTENVAQRLLRNCYGVAARYVYGDGSMKSTLSSGDALLGASMPRLENGAMYTFWKDSEVYRVPGNYDCQMEGRLTSGNYDRYASGAVREADTDMSPLENITDRYWRNYRFWSCEFDDQLHELTIPASEMSQFFKEMGWMEDPHDVHDMWKSIADLEFGSMSEHAKNMVYRDHSRPSTASIIKVDLPASSDAFSQHDGLTHIMSAAYSAGEEDNIDDNWFERFALWSGRGFSAEIGLAQTYPSLTPNVMFHSDAYADIAMADCADDDEVAGEAILAVSENGATPIIMNTTPEYLGWKMPGQLRSTSELRDRYIKISMQQHDDMGPGSVMIDIAASSTHGLARAELTTQGCDPDEILSFIRNFSAFIAAEFPAKQWVDVQPLVDNTDIYQCGYLYWNQYDRIDAGIRDEVYNHLANAFNIMSIAEQDEPIKTNYVKGTYDALADAYTVHAGDVYGDSHSQTGHVVAHMTNRQYMSRIMDALVFVGAMPFNAPNFIFEDERAALPFQEINDQWRKKEGDTLVCDPGYRSLHKYIRAYREVNLATEDKYVVTGASADPDWAQDTDERLVSSTVPNGTTVKKDQTVALLINVTSDATWSETYQYIKANGIFKGLIGLWKSGKPSIHEVKAPEDGVWYGLAGGLRIKRDRVIGYVLQKDSTIVINAKDITFGNMFIRNKAYYRTDDAAGGALPVSVPVMAADLYDTMTNVLNTETADAAQNLAQMRKWQFDPAYGPVLPFLMADIMHNNTSRSIDSNRYDDSIETVSEYLHEYMSHYGVVYSWLPVYDKHYDEHGKTDYHMAPPAVNDGVQLCRWHKWSRSIAQITLDPILNSGNQQLTVVKGDRPVRFITYYNRFHDAASFQAAASRITCANAGHLPSMMEFVKQSNATKGDEGFYYKSSTGVQIAKYVLEPKPRNTYDSVGNTHGAVRDTQPTKGAFDSVSTDSTPSSESRPKRHKHSRRHRAKGAKSPTLLQPDVSASAVKGTTLEVPPATLDGAKSDVSSSDDRKKVKDAIMNPHSDPSLKD